MGGEKIVDQNGVYGTKGVPAEGNYPGSRDFLGSWMDSEGNFWLFGGYGYNESGVIGDLNDLWKIEVFSSTTTPSSGNGGGGDGDDSSSDSVIIPGYNLYAIILISVIAFIYIGKIANIKKKN